MRTALYLKTATEVRDEVEDYLNDADNTLATAAQYLSIIQRSVSSWGRRVVVPHIYEFDFADGEFEYELPRYIRRPFYLQIRQGSYPIAESDTLDAFHWDDFPAYDVRPSTTGQGFTLHLQAYPESESGRITWFAENGGFPATPTVTTTVNSSVTTIAVSSTAYATVSDSGFYKVENEWCAYAGLDTRSATGFSTSNVVRGFYDTTAASHVSTTAISWGIGVDDQRLWQQLYDRAAGFVHLLNMNKSTGEDSNRHEKLFVAYRDMADSFWRREGYTTQASPRFVPKRSSMGIMQWQ